MITLYIDADSLPKTHRAIVLRRIIKNGMAAYFVADRPLKDVQEAIGEDSARRREPYRDKLSKEELRAIKSGIKMVVVESGENSADDKLVKLATRGSIAITHDIPLASRLLEKGVIVINDRGQEYTSDIIKELLSVRNTSLELREMGIFDDKSSRFNSRIINDFANCFDSVLTRAEKTNN